MTGSRRALPVKTVLPSTSAASKFRGFKPGTEGPQQVRQPQVIETVLGKLRSARELLVGMTPQQVFEVLEFHRGVTLFEAVQLAETTGKLIVPNLVHERLFSKSDISNIHDLPYPVWSGTMVVSEAPDKGFGEFVEYSRIDAKRDPPFSIKFEVPKEFRGGVNCALVFEHPDFRVLDLGGSKYELKLEDSSLVYVIEDFHVRWYHRAIQNTLDVPRAVEMLINSSSWYLFRSDSACIIPIVRQPGDEFSMGEERQQFVVEPIARFNVALFG